MTMDFARISTEKLVKRLKGVMIAMSIMFILTGLSLVVIGIIWKTYAHRYWSFVGAILQVTPNVIVVVGCVVLVLAYYSYQGSVRRNLLFLLIFMLIAIILLITEIVIVVCLYIHADDIMDEIENSMKVSIVYSSIDDELRDIWDYFQLNLQCCGVHDSMDYVRSNITPPNSCCGESSGKGFCTVVSGIPGCFTELLTVISNQKVLLISCFLMCMFVQLLSIATAVILARAICRFHFLSKEGKISDKSPNKEGFTDEYSDVSESTYEEKPETSKYLSNLWKKAIFHHAKKEHRKVKRTLSEELERDKNKMQVQKDVGGKNETNIKAEIETDKRKEPDIIESEEHKGEKEGDSTEESEFKLGGPLGRVVGVLLRIKVFMKNIRDV